MKIAAVILAGGRGERLGGANKALLDLNGETFVERAMRACAGCSPVLVAVGRQEFDLPAGTSAILDIEGSYAGPLAGVAAAVGALENGNHDALLSLAVDGPLFPADFLERALPLLDKAPAIIAAYGGQLYPTNGLWRLSAIRALPAGVRDGTAPHSLKRLSERLGATVLDYAEFVAEDPFRNANTPQDLAFLRGAARAGRAG